MTNENIENKQEEVKEPKRFEKTAKAGLLIVGGIGLGFGILGFKAGIKLGRNQGFKAGVVYSQEKFYDTMKYLADAVNKESEGE